jgi:ABC-type bacteriocin/lantibiotic exporter with double-glycine peptidase domain
MANLQAWADQLGFTSRALALTAAEVSEFKLPLLLQWQAEHWVVLKRITNKAWLINDPAVGERWISNAQAQRQFAGFALEIAPPPSPSSIYQSFGKAFQVWAQPCSNSSACHWCWRPSLC